MLTPQTSAQRTSVDIPLGYHHEIEALFRFGDHSPRLEDAITFVFSQTLQRDLYFGSWAQAYRNGNGQYRLKIVSPCDDVSAYERLIPQYIEAAGKPSATTTTFPTKRAKTGSFLRSAWPGTESIQLLHFPPLETFTYKNYLYSPTNRRWECLLAQNGFNGTDNTTVERIVDVAPIAAPGGAGEALTDYNEDFIPYAKAQLRNYLRPLPETDSNLTQPMVAYGEPVHKWLTQAFKLPKTPDTLDIVELTVLEASAHEPAPKTWVLCANHPSEYLYDTDLPLSDACKPNGDYPPPIHVMCQDLIAAGWQAHMSAHPADDPHQVLADLETQWGWDRNSGTVRKDKEQALLNIMKEQNKVGYDNNSFTPPKPRARLTPLR